MMMTMMMRRIHRPMMISSALPLLLLLLAHVVGTDAQSTSGARVIVRGTSSSATAPPAPAPKPVVAQLPASLLAASPLPDRSVVTSVSANATKTARVARAIQSSSFETVRINCGSSVPHTDALGRVWSADRLFTGGYTYDSAVPIADTNEDPLYNCERYGQSTYSIPVPSGSYTVVLHLSEIFHTAVNKRVFDISVEGQMINDLDLVQLGGGVAFKALTRQVNVQVSDGFLTIQLLDNVPLIDFPKLSAIEVRSNSGGGGGGGPSPTPPLGNFSPIRINCGGLVPYTDSQGRVWSADQFFLGGTVFDSAAPIADTVDDPLYNCERYGQATYSIPVPEGSYTVVLHLSEIYHTAPSKRVYDLSVESELISDIDLVQLGGGTAFKALTRRVQSVYVGDGFLTIKLLDNVPLIDFPKLSAIEVLPLNSPISPSPPPPPPSPPPPIPAPIKAPVFTPPSTFVPIRINCGGLVPYTDSQGRVWSADQFFLGGTVFDSAAPIADTVDDPLYNCERYGQATYLIPVPTGEYSVVLHFSEIFHTAVAKRVFDISVEGELISDLDLVQIGGGVAFKALTRRVQAVFVGDGFLTVKLLDNVPLIDFPKLSAIEVLPLNTPISPPPPVPAPVKAPTKAPIVAPVPLPTPVGGPSANFEPILINCGGDSFVDSQRRVWQADNYFVGGTKYWVGVDIVDTIDDDIYSSSRWGNMQYSIPLPNGLYEVVIHLSETFFTAEGKRKFSVKVEATDLPNIDIIQLGQGLANKAVTKTASASVSDGFLSITFSATVDYASIAGIEVNRLGVAPPRTAPIPTVPVSSPSTFQPVLISCGSSKDFVDSRGRRWLSDRYANGGSTYMNAAPAIANTEDDGLYHSDRWGSSFSYEIPLPEGNYKAILHFAEIYYLFSKPDQRTFDIVVEGGDLIEDVDIIKEAGAIYTAMKRETEITPVVDGFLSLKFKQNDPQVDNPKISAIEIVKVSDHAAHALTGGPYSAVDLDASGTELVRVDASESHTHGVGNVLVSHTWKLGDTIIGTGAVTSLNIPVGEHEVELTVTDKAGTVNSDKTTITVKVRGFPELFSLSPTSGAVSGGTTVTLTGQDIGSATSVRFGRAAVTNIRVINSSTITVVTPEAAVGVPVAVSVVTPVGESSPQRYVYESVAPISFAIQELLGISLPTAVAFGPDGKLYVGTYGGKLARFTLNDSYDKVVGSVIADRFPNNGKMCILGIAFDPLETPELGDQISVYISLSEVYHGQYRNSFGQAINGKIQVVRGANLDQWTSVVTGLPVSEKDHAVNGIHFGDNGQLYIAVGGNTNAGLPGSLTGSQRMRENYFSAAILVANLARPGFDGFIKYDADIDGSPVAGFGSNGVEIFAAGTRNPYGVYVHSNGKVYATDNGGNKDLGRRATGCGPGESATELDVGDQLLLVQRGRYYGHPNHKRAQTDPRQCRWRSRDEPADGQFTPPILKTESSLGNIIEFESDHFKGQMRGDLIIAKYSDSLFRVILSPDGESVNPFSDPMVRLAGAQGLAVTQAPDGSLIDARHNDNKLFFYKPVEIPSSEVDIKAVFPRRGGLAGGSKLMIFGTNFASSSATTVTIGGNACTNVVVKSANKIECRLPTGTVGKKDVVVTMGGATDTYVGGYRYITGLPL